MSHSIQNPKIRKKLFLTRILSKWPILAWIAIAFIAVWGYENSRQQLTFTGRVKTDTLLVSASDQVTILAIHVQAGQPVQAGDQLASLDTSDIDLKIAELTIEIQQDHRERERRYLEARHRLITQSQDLLVKQAEDQARLKVLGKEDILLKDVFDRGLIGRDSYIANLASVEALRSALELYPQLIEELTTELSQLEASKSIWDIQNSDTLIKSDQRLNLLALQKENRRLTTPHSGFVSVVYANPDETIDAGQPILKLVFNSHTQVIAFIPEAETMPPHTGDILYVTTQAQHGTWLEAKVTQLSPEIIAVPDHISPLPDKMITGRYCYLELLAHTSLTNGETVVIARKKPSGFLDVLNN